MTTAGFAATEGETRERTRFQISSRVIAVRVTQVLLLCLFFLRSAFREKTVPTTGSATRLRRASDTTGRSSGSRSKPRG